MNSTVDIIKRFPEDPDRPIIYFVYNEDLVHGTESIIRLMKGEDYFNRHVTVKPLRTEDNKEHIIDTKHVCYYDPLIHQLKGNGYN